MRELLAGVVSICLLVPVACGAQDGSTARPKAGAAGATAAKSGAPLRLKKISVPDPMIGCDALTMLIPDGWKTDGGVQWQFQWTNLATANMRISDPKSAAVLEILPVTPACFDESGTMFLQPGTNYMGSYVIAPPRDVKQYVEAIVVPLFRKNVEKMRVGALTPLPAVARAVEKNVQEAGVAKRVDSGKVRLEYESMGKPMEEDVYITIVQARSQALPGMVIWNCEHQYAFRAEKGRLDSLAPLLQAMVSSVSIDLKWYAGYSQVVALRNKGQMDQIRAAGELSRQISRDNDSMIASLRSSWEARQKSEDHVYQQFGESIRGVETYQNTFDERQVELPSGYDGVWVNSSGEYVLSNDGGFDPNVGSTLEWRRLEHTPR